MAGMRDEYGNELRRTDEYGNPVVGHGATAGYGGQQLQADKEHHGGLTGMLHRSGSSSSSSSEDDGEGGRRKKKGLKEKIKEKLPGSHESQQPSATQYGTTTTEQHHENKGFMDKIKEKLPGHHGTEH